MAENNSSTVIRVGPCCGTFIIIFILIKTMGMLLTGWSWWWVLFPWVPVIYAVLKLVGLVQ